MNKAQLLIAFLGSAAVGALVSNIITAFGQWLERKSRREELILTKAIEMAEARWSNSLAAGFGGNMMPEIEMAERYHRYLIHLLKHGKLPADYESKIVTPVGKESPK